MRKVILITFVLIVLGGIYYFYKHKNKLFTPSTVIKSVTPPNAWKGTYIQLKQGDKLVTDIIRNVMTYTVNPLYSLNFDYRTWTFHHEGTGFLGYVTGVYTLDSNFALPNTKDTNPINAGTLWDKVPNVDYKTVVGITAIPNSTIPQAYVAMGTDLKKG